MASGLLVQVPMSLGQVREKEGQVTPGQDRQSRGNETRFSRLETILIQAWASRLFPGAYHIGRYLIYNYRKHRDSNPPSPDNSPSHT